MAKLRWVCRCCRCFLQLEHQQAPQGPDRKDMTYLKKEKKLEEGNENNFPMKKACVLHLSHNYSFRDSLCARDEDALTLSASVTEATATADAGKKQLQRSGLLGCRCSGLEMAGSFVWELMSRGLYDNECQVFPR